MSEHVSSTGVTAKIRRWLADPSNTLIAPPNANKWLRMRSAIASGSSLRASGHPVWKRHSWSTIFQSSITGRTVAWCTYWKCTLSGPFSATTCGCTGSRSARCDISGYAR